MDNFCEKYASGRRWCTCYICEAKGEFLQYKPKEQMMGTGEKFNYFLCPECECLQLEEIPENLGEYYGKEYYSYGVPEIQEMRPKKEFEEYYILDVGCGSGAWLCSLTSQGYTKLYGCDPYIEKDIIYDRIIFGKFVNKGGIEMADVNSIDVEDDQFAYRYDTQLLIDRRDEDLDEDAIADYITEHFEGNSLIAAGDEDLIKIHFHTNEPWKVLEYCASLGEIYDIVIEDMERQAKGLQG